MVWGLHKIPIDQQAITQSFKMKDALSPSRQVAYTRKLIDYTKEGKNVAQSRCGGLSKSRSTSDLLHQCKAFPPDASSHRSDPLFLEMSSSSLDSVDIWCDGKLEDTDEQEDSIDFFLKIPSRESRLNRSDNRDRLNFTKEPKSRRKRKKGVIQAMLTQTPIRLELPLTTVTCHDMGEQRHSRNK
jgi:hypothetical protein